MLASFWEKAPRLYDLDGWHCKNIPSSCKYHRPNNQKTTYQHEQKKQQEQINNFISLVDDYLKK